MDQHAAAAAILGADIVQLLQKPRLLLLTLLDLQALTGGAGGQGGAVHVSTCTSTGRPTYLSQQLVMQLPQLHVAGRRGIRAHDDACKR